MTDKLLAAVPRLLAGLFLAGAVALLPWWMVLAFGALFAFFFGNFYELLAAGLAIDLLYGGGIARAFGIPFFVSAASMILYLVVTRVKSHLLIYR